METPTGNEHKYNPEKRRKLILLLSAIFLSIAFIYALYWVFFGRFSVYTNNAYVEGNLVQLMPQVSGVVSTIVSDDTQLVIQGQTVIKLDDTDAKNNLENAQASLATTVRQVSQYYSQAKQLEASLKIAAAELLKADEDLKRRQKLTGINSISKEELQHFKTKLEAAKAQYDQTTNQLQASKSLTQGTQITNHPLVLEAAAKFRMAYLNLKRTNIIAPVTGYIAKRTVQLGQQVSSGTPLLFIVPLHEIWINANFKESQLKRIRIGQPATITIDSYGSLMKFNGKVQGISPGTGSVFSLLPPQNATGNWIKIVQRLPVRIALDPNQVAKHPLQIGLSAEVTINTRNKKGSILTMVANQHPTYTTTIYHNLLSTTEALISQIIHDNYLS